MFIDDVTLDWQKLVKNRLDHVPKQRPDLYPFQDDMSRNSIENKILDIRTIRQNHLVKNWIFLALIRKRVPFQLKRNKTTKGYSHFDLSPSNATRDHCNTLARDWPLIWRHWVGFLPDARLLFPQKVSIRKKAGRRFMRREVWRRNHRRLWRLVAC